MTTSKETELNVKEEGTRHPGQESEISLGEIRLLFIGTVIFCFKTFYNASES